MLHEAEEHVLHALLTPETPAAKADFVRLLRDAWGAVCGLLGVTELIVRRCSSVPLRSLESSQVVSHSTKRGVPG